MKILSLAFLFVPLTALANSTAQSTGYEVRCQPSFRSQGTVLIVAVEYGSDQAIITAGAPSRGTPVRDEKFIIKRSAPHLGTTVYAGDQFELVVDEHQATATLQAVFAGRSLQVESLACDIQMFRPHPGISMSN